MNVAAMAWTFRAWSHAIGWTPGDHTEFLVRNYQNSGNVVAFFRDNGTGAVLGPYLVRPASTTGWLTHLWPVIASLGISLIAVGIALVTRRRPDGAIRVPRLTMFQVMVAVGAISTWLWLARINLVLTVGGTLVLGLMLHSAYRRGSLAKEIRAEGATATGFGLTRAGFAGYSIAVLLALAWVIIIVVWDSYQVRP